MNEEKLLRLDQLISNGVVHENYKDLNTSIFSMIYLRAGRLIENIISDNYEWTQSGKNKKNSDFERSNVISFVGQRGTGKTSAMLSFKDMLDFYTQTQRFGADQVRMPLLNTMKNQNVKFYTLDCIDASILEESENVFVLILAAMFSKVHESAHEKTQKINEYDNRVLYQKFEKIYEDYTSINFKESISDGYSAFEKLRNAASSQKIRENFEELVKLYLNIIDDNENDFSKTDQKFLVISLDDIDIARRKKGNGKENWGTYKIMGTIYKYLTVPGVIVLTAYDYSNLQERCLKFFEVENGQREGCERPTLQFIEKVFPIYSRLYMPSLISNDAIFENEIKISVENNKWNILKNFYIREGINTLSIKEFVFFLLYDKTDVILDYEREKKHFFVPETLRDLFNLIELLNKMESYNHKIDTEDDMIKFQRNIEWLEEDCNFRYKEEILVEKKEESSLVTLWNEIPVGQRGRQIVSAISKEVLPLGLDIKRKYRTDVDSAKKAREDYTQIIKYPEYDNSNVKYSYAELLHSIFHMTRFDKGYSKKFVACILYSYTLQLTEIYKLYLWYKHQFEEEEFYFVYRTNCDCDEALYGSEIISKLEKVTKCYKQLSNVIGETICGKWTQYFFPEIVPCRKMEIYGRYTDVRHRPVIAGYINNRGIEFAFEFLESDSERIIDLKIKSMLFIAALRLDISQWNSKNLECRKGTDGRYILYLRQNQSEDIELTAFFKHTFRYTEFLNKMECLILDQFMRGKTSLKIQKKIKNVFSDLWKSYYDWDYTYGNAMIPFYNLDVTYNMIKKLYLEYEQNPMDDVMIAMNDRNTPFLDAYKKMLNKFIRCLNNLDKKYYLEKNGTSLSKTFVECPFYKMIDELQNDPESRVRISNYICNIGMDILSDRMIKDEPKE